MKIWKPFTRWTAKMGKRIEHRWHADFELNEDEWLALEITGEEIFVEQPSSGKRYCVHLKICLEEFSEEG